MYEIIIFIMIVLLIVCNKKTIENFTGGKCDINEQRFKLIEEKLALQKKVQPVVVNNNLCDERQSKEGVNQITPPQQKQQPIIIIQGENYNIDEIENIILKERNENQKKLDEINKKIDELKEIEDKEEEDSEKSEEEEDSEIYELISEIKDGITMPSIPNDMVNNIMVGTAILIGILFLYFGIVIFMNMVRRKANEIKLLDLSYEDAIKAVKEKVLRKKYGLSENLFK